MNIIVYNGEECLCSNIIYMIEMSLKIKEALLGSDSKIFVDSQCRNSRCLFRQFKNEVIKVGVNDRKKFVNSPFLLVTQDTSNIPIMYYMNCIKPILLLGTACVARDYKKIMRRVVDKIFLLFYGDLVKNCGYYVDSFLFRTGQLIEYGLDPRFMPEQRDDLIGHSYLYTSHFCFDQVETLESDHVIHHSIHEALKDYEGKKLIYDRHIHNPMGRCKELVYCRTNTDYTARLVNECIFYGKPMVLYNYNPVFEYYFGLTEKDYKPKMKIDTKGYEFKRFIISEKLMRSISWITKGRWENE